MPSSVANANVLNSNRLNRNGYARKRPLNCGPRKRNEKNSNAYGLKKMPSKLSTCAWRRNEKSSNTFAV